MNSLQLYCELSAAYAAMIDEHDSPEICPLCDADDLILMLCGC